MPTSTTVAAKASYKKLPGLLELTDTHLQWTQDGKSPSVRVPLTQVHGLFSSKEGAAQVRLKISLVGDDNGHSFAFTSPKAIMERDRFKAELTTVLSQNRAAQDVAARAPAPVASSHPPAPIVTPKTQPATPTPRQPSATPSRAVSVSSSDLRNVTIIPGIDAAMDLRLRKTVLMSNPALASLHRDLVASGQLTEAEFWDGREHLLFSLASSESQRKGKSGQIVDPRPETVDGEIKIVMTPQLIHDIFDEYPVVAKAHRENVPSKLTEAEFWARYFKSKLYHALRASIRSTEVQHVVQEDPILDQYMPEIDDGLEPRNQRNERVELFVDLGATNEDHAETGNEKDVTMLPGRQRGALPLIRKFNEHSERLLNATLGDIPAAKRQKINTDGEYGQIDLDDLHDPRALSGIELEMQDRQRYFEGGVSASDAEAENGQRPFDLRAVLRKTQAELNSWETNLIQLKVDRKPADGALLAMTKNVASRLDVKARKNDIPPAVFRQMQICQAATNEFLRQFWGATYPPSVDQVISPQTPIQRAAKAAKMIGYLYKTQEKVDALVSMGPGHSVDPQKIEIGLNPVLNAAKRAIAFHHAKTSKPTRG